MDSLIIAGRTFASRLIIGRGRNYPTHQVMQAAHEASGADMVTVAVRRVNISDRSKESLLDYIDPKKYFLLPNTAGVLHGGRRDPDGAAGARGRDCRTG